MLALALVVLAAAAPPPARFIHVDARRQLVDVSLVAAYDGTNNGFNFDGYARELMWTVPAGWRVRVTCENRGPLRHSCAVVQGADSTRPAFSGAETPAPFTGLEAGRSATFTFRASTPGVYRFADVVPGHEAARMYDVLKIAVGAKPSIRDLQAP